MYLLDGVIRNYVGDVLGELGVSNEYIGTDFKPYHVTRFDEDDLHIERVETRAPEVFYQRRLVFDGTMCHGDDLELQEEWQTKLYKLKQRALSFQLARRFSNYWSRFVGRDYQGSDFLVAKNAVIDLSDEERLVCSNAKKLFIPGEWCDKVWRVVQLGVLGQWQRRYPGQCENPPHGKRFSPGQIIQMAWAIVSRFGRSETEYEEHGREGRLLYREYSGYGLNLKAFSRTFDEHIEITFNLDKVFESGRMYDHELERGKGHKRHPFVVDEVNSYFLLVPTFYGGDWEDILFQLYQELMQKPFQNAARLDDFCLRYFNGQYEDDWVKITNVDGAIRIYEKSWMGPCFYRPDEILVHEAGRLHNASPATAHVENLITGIAKRIQLVKGAWEAEMARKAEQAKMPSAAEYLEQMAAGADASATSGAAAPRDKY